MMIMIIHDHFAHFAVLSAATFLMRKEAAAMTVRGAACFAHVWLFPRMSICVLLQRAESLEGLAARFAQVIRFAGVSRQVPAKG